MWRFIWLSLILALAVPVIAAEPVGAQYLKGVEIWRSEFDADIRTAGWLETVGREKVREGTWTVGSSPDSGIVLPPPAPTLVGSLTRRGDRFKFEPTNGAPVLIDDQPVTAAVELSSQEGAGTIRAGGLRLTVRKIGEDFYLNIANPNSHAVAAFKGTSWFPVDPSYRLVGRFIPYTRPQEVVLTLTFASATKTFKSTGDVSFRLNGRPMKLKTYLLDDELFLIFQDETNGIETYGGGRFLSAPMPKNGVTTLDFNKAFNPYCAVNPFAICPLAPAVNRLPVRVAAGAKLE